MPIVPIENEFAALQTSCLLKTAELLSLLEGKSAKTNIDADFSITDETIEDSLQSSKIERDEIEE